MHTELEKAAEFGRALVGQFDKEAGDPTNMSTSGMLGAVSSMALGGGVGAAGGAGVYGLRKLLGADPKKMSLINHLLVGGGVGASTGGNVFNGYVNGMNSSLGLNNHLDLLSNRTGEEGVTPLADKLK